MFGNVGIKENFCEKKSNKTDNLITLGILDTEELEISIGDGKDFSIDSKYLNGHFVGAKGVGCSGNQKTLGRRQVAMGSAKENRDSINIVVNNCTKKKERRTRSKDGSEGTGEKRYAKPRSTRNFLGASNPDVALVRPAKNGQPSNTSCKKRSHQKCVVNSSYNGPTHYNTKLQRGSLSRKSEKKDRKTHKIERRSRSVSCAHKTTKK